MRPEGDLAYRPDIDGLRAIAVATVVAYHAAPGWVRGGFIGVDVFFVISGFLITSIILRQRDEGRFSLVAFYARRIRRLFPALILVLAATGLAGWALLLPHEVTALGKHIAAGAFYVINITLKRETGYFDADAGVKPLLHLWSLAVEEQFYLIWPVLLLLIRRRRPTIVLLSAILVVSLCSNILAAGRNAAAAFYLPHNRFWELALGALLAWAAISGPLRFTALGGSKLEGRHAWIQSAASTLGLVLILGSAFGYGSGIAYPGAWAIVPCAGAALAIAAGPQALPNRLLLASPPLVLIGLISYPLYLWHWPLLSFPAVLDADRQPGVRAGAVALAILLALLTYFAVELPLRNRKSMTYTLVLLAMTVMLGVGGLLARHGVIVPRLSDPPFQQISAAISDWRFPDGLDRSETPAGLTLYRAGGTNGRAVLFYGDSNVQQYWPRIEALIGRAELRRPVIFATIGGCLPISGTRDKAHPDCDGFAESALGLARDASVSRVVIAASWLGYFRNRRYELTGPGGGRLMPGSQAWHMAFERLAGDMAALRNAGKDVVLVLGIPNGGELDPLAGITRSLWGTVTLRPAELSRHMLDDRYGEIGRQLIEAAQRAGAAVIDPVAALCDAETCPAQTPDGIPIFKDSSHLRASFVRNRADFIDRVIADP